MRKPASKTAKVATGVGLALGGAALAATLYTEIMTTVIARRRSSAADMLMTLAKGEPVDTPAVIRKEWIEILESAPTEPVEIRSHDGYVLRAHWYPVENACRTVILAHGWHGRWCRDFCGLAPYLHDHACNLLLIEQRCHDTSGGDLISYGIQERYDVLSWLSWVEEHESRHPLPIYLCGLSMGASTVLMAAGLPIAGRVSGIIADCGYSTPTEIIQITLEKSIGKLASPTLAAVNANCKRREHFTFKDYTPIEAMTQNTEVPCLFVHGDADDFVPWRMSVENFYACRAPKDLLIVHGAGHGLSFLVDPDTYKNRLQAFFETYDHSLPLPEKATRRSAVSPKKAKTAE